MNERNVEALASLIHRASTGRLQDWDDAKDLAVDLVELGVLVPGVLTDEEVGALDLAVYPRHVAFHEPAEVRSILERIAQGAEVPT